MATAPLKKTPARILIVDTNKSGLLARKSVLEGQGHEALTLNDPREALELCTTQPFQILVTDYKLPKMNGCELIEQVRKLDQTMSIILLSGFTDALGLNEQNTGADIVLQKNANEVNHLIRAVNRLLRQPRRKPAGKAASKAAAKPAKRKTL